MKTIYDDLKTPGQLISILAKEKGWSNRLLSSILEIEETKFNRYVRDKIPITAELAIALEEIFNVPAEKFLNLQQSYELAKARITTIPDPKRAVRAKVFGRLPISEMIKRGWLNIENSKDAEKVESELAHFFQVTNIEDIESIPHAARKTNSAESSSMIQLAWLYRVKEIAGELIVPSYNEAKTRSMIQKLKALLSAPDEARSVPKMLAECGIRFVVVEAMKSSKIDGVCLWLDENSPVIGMSLRFDRMDNFWFVLRHELEHILLRHGGINSPKIDIDIGALPEDITEEIRQEEELANAAAADFCVPKAKIDSFIARKSPLFPTRDFIGFTKLLGIHPCLVAGQIQFKTSRYDLFRGHLVKIRSHILDSAIVDGWGDIFPLIKEKNYDKK